MKCTNILSHFTGTSSLGSLNPDLYKDPAEGELDEYPLGHIGRIWFTLDYDKPTEKMHVTVDKVRNLPPRGKQHGCDAYVRLVECIYRDFCSRKCFGRLIILSDERRMFETKLRRKCTNPNFNEMFTVKVLLFHTCSFQ